jgi:PAS domain-containing protein
MAGAVLECSDDAVAVFRPSRGTLVFANEAFWRLAGAAPEEGRDRALSHYLGDALARRLQETLEPLLGGILERAQFELDLERPLRPTRRVEVSASLFWPTPRRPLAAVSLRDVTERFRQETRLLERLHFLDRVVGGTLQGILVTDMHGKILVFNAGAQTLLRGHGPGGDDPHARA